MKLCHVAAVLGGLISLVSAAQAAPASQYGMDQVPVTGINAITNGATTNTTFWGTLKGSGAMPVLTNGAAPGTGAAWQFRGGYYLGDGPNGVTRSLGDITNTTGLSVAFWVRYASSNANIRVCGLGGSGEVFDFMVQTGGKLMFTAGYQPDNSRWVAMTPSTVVFDGNWHHVVGTLDFRRTTSNAVVFIDGAPVLTNNATFFHSFTNNGTLCIGARGNGSGTACAIDQFIVYTNALQAAEVAQLYTTGNASNHAPIVSVTAAQTQLVWTNSTTNISTTLMASLSDDGRPAPPGSVTSLWTQMSGPANSLAFTTPTNATTSVSFTRPGLYVLRCTASDGELSDWDEVAINVYSNQAPVVAAWASTTVLLSTNPTTLTLAGWVQDDGLPNPPNLTTTLWTRLSSPGNVPVILGSPTNINTSVTIPTNIGAYVLRVTAHDGLLTGTAEVTINVVSNLAPKVSAWTLTPIAQWPSNQFALQATVSDDGRPNPPGAVTSLWSKVSGPGHVTFENANSLNATAMCAQPGVYQFRLVASDSVESVTNEVWVNIWSNSPGVLPPVSLRPFTANPAPYEHPRIFFTDADRPALQARAASDPIVQEGIFQPDYGLQAVVSNTIDDPASTVGRMFIQLAAGDTTVDTSALVLAQVAAADFLNGDAASGLYGPLSAACYLAWLWPTNMDRLQQLATAVSTAAVCHDRWYVPGTSELSPDVYADLGFCYDLMYDWMSESQRQATRAFIVRMTANRRTIGWNEPDYVNSSNWRTFHDHLILAQLSIEGETGFDAVSLATNAASLKTFATRWGITEGGFNREGNGYFAMGMRNAILAAYALSRRGENLLATTRLYQSQLDSFYMLAPWGQAMFGHHDGSGWGNGGNGAPMVYFYVMKYLFPDDPLVDSVFQNNRAYTANNAFPLIKAIFGVSPLTHNPDFTATAAAKNLSLSKFDPQRGMGVARSDWGANALQLNFDCRFDTMALGHLHADRNNFTLLSHGRSWIGDPGYHIEENDAHSTVLIDGLGQAGTASSFHWPSMPGRPLEFRAQPMSALFAGDAKPAYDYSWDWAALGGGKGYLPYTSYLANGIVTPWRWVDLMYAPPGDLGGDNAWMTNYVRANPQLYNPVQRAFRTTLLLRGSRPYVLVVDDIQKDDQPHTYEWSVNTISSEGDPNLVLVSGATATDALFRHAADAGGNQPRLLVRVLEGRGTAAPIELVDSVNAQGTRTKRIVISRRDVVAPDFKVLLFPHLGGDTLPATTWSNNLLTVQMSDGQSDRIYFNTDADGRTRISTYRIAGTGAVPSRPAGLAAVSGAGEIGLTWLPSGGATAYNVFSATNSGGAFNLLAGNVTGTNYSDANVPAGVTNFYVVTALNENGESEPSAEVSGVAFEMATARPVITHVSVIGNQIMVSGTNGLAGKNYLVLTSTHVALPLEQWSVAATNQFGPEGAFLFANAFDPATPQRYYLLRLLP